MVYLCPMNRWAKTELKDILLCVSYRNKTGSTNEREGTLLEWSSGTNVLSRRKDSEFNYIEQTYFHWHRKTSLFSLTSKTSYQTFPMRYWTISLHSQVMPIGPASISSSPIFPWTHSNALTCTETALVHVTNGLKVIWCVSSIQLSWLSPSSPRASFQVWLHPLVLLPCRWRFLHVFFSGCLQGPSLSTFAPRGISSISCL